MRLSEPPFSGVLSLYLKKGAIVPLTSHAQKRASTIALAIIVTCQLMVVLDATVVNIALVPIKHSLHFSSAGLSWVIDAYSLAFGGLLLLGGRAGDVFGRRRMLVIGLTIFTAASLLGAWRRPRPCCSSRAPSRVSAPRWPRPAR
jgi:hypothetical protein